MSILWIHQYSLFPQYHHALRCYLSTFQNFDAYTSVNFLFLDVPYCWFINTELTPTALYHAWMKLLSHMYFFCKPQPSCTTQLQHYTWGLLYTVKSPTKSREIQKVSLNRLQKTPLFTWWEVKQEDKAVGLSSLSWEHVHWVAQTFYY